MKFFIGQAVTGEDLEVIRLELSKIYKILEEKGHSSYDTLRENEDEFQKKTKKEMMKHAFLEIDKSDALLAIIRSDRKSEGLLMEIGYCLANNKKIVLIIKKDIKNTYLREVADKLIEYETSEDLIEILEGEEL